MIGVEDVRVNKCLQIIRDNCKSRDQLMAPLSLQWEALQWEETRIPTSLTQ